MTGEETDVNQGERDVLESSVSDELAARSVVPAQTDGGLRKLILRGGGILYVRQVISIALNLLGILVITRVIGPEGYGAYAAASGIYLFVESLGEAGIEVYLIRQPGSVEVREYHVASFLLLALGLALLAALELSAGMISSWVNVASVGSLLRVLALSLPVQLVTRAAAARLERTLDYRRITMVAVVSQLVHYVVAIPLALIGYGAWSLVFGSIIGLGFYCVFVHVAARHVPRFAWDAETARQILRYAFGFSTAQWVWQLRMLANPLIVGPLLGAAAVGQVAMAVRIVDGLAFMRPIAWRLSVATLARIQDEPARLVVAVTEGTQLQTLLIAPLLLGFGWIAGWLLPEIFGSRWTPILEIYPFIALATISNTQFSLHASVLYVKQRSYDVGIFNLVNVFIFAAGLVIFIPLTGLSGYGWAEMGALASYFLLHRFICRAVGHPSYKISAIWWAGTALGLFSSRLGSWTIVMPFIALIWPASLQRLRTMLREMLALAHSP
jgi:O-antigen/teichoic acid export membrane protein